MATEWSNFTCNVIMKYIVSIMGQASCCSDKGEAMREQQLVIIQDHFQPVIVKYILILAFLDIAAIIISLGYKLQFLRFPLPLASRNLLMKGYCS